MYGWSDFFVNKARESENNAFLARLAARQIQVEIGILRSSLGGIKRLHNSYTWDSNIALQSRQKLERFYGFYIETLAKRFELLVERLEISSLLWSKNAENLWGLAKVEI